MLFPGIHFISYDRCLGAGMDCWADFENIDVSKWVSRWSLVVSDEVENVDALRFMLGRRAGECRS